MRKFKGLLRHLRRQKNVHSKQTPIKAEFVRTLLNRKVNENSVIDILQAAWKTFCHMQATHDLIEQVEERLDELEGVLEFS